MAPPFLRTKPRKPWCPGNLTKRGRVYGQNVVLRSVLDPGPSRPVDARPLPPALIVSVAWIKGPIVFGIEVDPSDSFAAFPPLMQWTNSYPAASQYPGLAVCQEYRRSKRRCATVREMKEGTPDPAIRNRSQATVRCRGQKPWWLACREVGTMIPTSMDEREASTSEPLLKCRKRIRRCRNWGPAMLPGSVRGLT